MWDSGVRGPLQVKALGDETRVGGGGSRASYGLLQSLTFRQQHWVLVEGTFPSGRVYCATQVLTQHSKTPGLSRR